MKRIGGLLAAVLLLAGCGGQSTQQSVEFRVPVFVGEATTGTVEDRVVATGTLRTTESVALRADSGGELRIARDAAGRRLVGGSRRRPGQLIAEIIGEEVRLNARSEATEQRFRTAKRDYDSKKALFDAGLLSETEFRQVESTLADARVDWERSQLTESRSKMTTPIGGVILSLARDESGMPLADGQLVSQGYVVAQIAPTDSLIADVDLVGPDVVKVEPGQPARVRHYAIDQSFPGRVLRLAPSLDPQTRTLRVEVAVDNSQRRLRPGMFVEVTMIAEHRDDVTVVPREAVTERGGRKVVFVLRGQKVSRRDVTLGLGDDEVVEIRQGLEPGERIVVRGLETLSDGSQVRVSGA